MTHQQIHDNEIIEQYVLQKLSPAERQAFQEHYFECDECFEETNIAARFIAGVRDASKSGALARERAKSASPTRWTPAVLIQGWARSWALPALAMALMLAVALVGLWALSLRRENRQLAEGTAEQSRVLERLQGLEAKVRELEASGSASQAQKESLEAEILRLKEELAVTARQRETQVAQVRQPEINSRQPEVNVPVRNIYPVGDAQRSGVLSEINRLNVPGGTRTFVLILGDYKPGYSNYRLEIRDPSGRLVTRRAGLKPDKNGELSVLLNRAQLSKGKYRLKLYGQAEPIAEYVVEVGQ